MEQGSSWVAGLEERVACYVNIIVVRFLGGFLTGVVVVSSGPAAVEEPPG